MFVTSWVFLLDNNDLPTQNRLKFKEKVNLKSVLLLNPAF